MRPGMAGGGLVAVGSGLGVALTSGFDTWLAGLGVAGALGAMGAAAMGLWWASLPLRLSDRILGRQTLGHPDLRVRAVLGRGRAMAGPGARVTVRHHGTDHDLAVSSPWGPAVVGPFTVLAVDRDGVLEAAADDPDARVTVAVWGSEAGARREAERSWPVSEVGQDRRFAPLLAPGRGGRVAWSWRTWRAVQPTADPDAG